MMAWYPLKLTFHVRSYAFGERLIPDKLGKRGVPEGVVAETWEVSDCGETTATVLNGALAGRTLHELTMDHPDELVGQGWRGPHFPLLEKFLDASHMLPVHLHANDETAKRKYDQPNGKTEAWHVLWAAPGASVLAGIRPGTSTDELVRAFKDQAYDRVMPRYPISPGDTVYVPGGVLHSFGPDTLIFEIQQTSDLAQTVMPTDLYGKALDVAVWDRNIRETLDELRLDYLPEPHAGLELVNIGGRRVVCCASPYFMLERWTLREPRVDPSHPWRCLTLTNVGNTVHLAYGEDLASVMELERGETCILPAAIGDVRLAPQGSSDLIACYVPDLGRDLFERLWLAGHSTEAILGLGDPAELAPHVPQT